MTTVVMKVCDQQTQTLLLKKKAGCMFRLKPIRHYQVYENNIKTIFYNCILGLRSQHSQAKNIFLLMGQQPPVGQGFLNMEVSLSY